MQFNKLLHLNMKNHIIASIMVLLSLRCYSSEWIAVGQQPDLPNAGQLESQLWKYLENNSKTEFQPREIYRYQYKFIGESLILINALCIQSPEVEAELGTYPGPTIEELKKQLYQVQDGGSCFFSIKYNLKNHRLSWRYARMYGNNLK
ncbi:hypothetical protein CBP51_01245 [Cellvibrio mixtus]|uniref:Uncharacterized protein n=1 Tax=Cellvibrio mixtus TaxID=39650 RepID=A0A266Q767_9GAMM|nr:hypothetical protein CBP51_01245 [Cellvibrio mixtus]